jgi:hypothetical protein
MKIWAYGDSFVAGDVDGPRGDSELEQLQKNRYETSWAAQLSQILNCELTNRAVSGTSNFPQIDNLIADIDQIQKDDLVFFGITSALRERSWLFSRAKEFYKTLKTKEEYSLGGQWLVETSKLEDTDHLEKTDFLFTVAMLEKLEEIYNIKIIKFNAFAEMQCPSAKNFIGNNIPGNTLLHLVTDNWGVAGVDLFKAHIRADPTGINSKLLTKRCHPNYQGHTKIARWINEYISNS